METVLDSAASLAVAPLLLLQRLVEILLLTPPTAKAQLMRRIWCRHLRRHNKARSRCRALIALSKALFPFLIFEVFVCICLLVMRVDSTTNHDTACCKENSLLTLSNILHFLNILLSPSKARSDSSTALVSHCTW